MNMLKQNCSFRFLLIHLDGTGQVVTQDIRRRRGVVVGRIDLPRLNPLRANALARSYGCSIVVRPKGAATATAAEVMAVQHFQLIGKRYTGGE